MKALKYISIVLIFLLSCEKPYDDPPIQTTGTVLVIEGLITNDEPPYSVKLTQSVPYNKTSQEPTLVKSALINITDNTGKIENLIEKPAGTYNTSATGMRGIIGRSYKIKVKLTDNSIYESDFIPLNPSPKIDSVYAEIGQVQSISQENGTTVVNTQLGLNVYIDATPYPDLDYYYKFKTSIVQEVQQTFYPFGKAASASGPPPSYIIYSWGIGDLDIKKDLKANTVQNLSQIKKFFIGFIPEYFSTASDTMHDAPIWDGAITTAEIYSVPKMIYEIFTQENAQTKPSNSIFDPIPTQLGTNIKCTSDPSKNVLGYFAAASVARIYHHFCWVHPNKHISSKDLDSIPKVFEPATPPDSTGPPNFWVFPN